MADKCSFDKSGQCTGDLTSLVSCKKDITGHLRYLKVPYLKTSATETDLLLYRSGFFDVEESCRRLLLICRCHRDSLGIYWRQPSTTCRYPLHNGKSKPDRAVDFNLSREIFYLFQVLVPVGSGICRSCRTKHPDLVASRCKMITHEEEEEGVEDTTGDVAQSSLQAMETTKEPDLESRNSQPESHYTASQFSDCSTSVLGSQTLSSHDEWEPEMSVLERVNHVIGQISNDRMSPLRSQLSTRWEEASDRTKSYYRRKAGEVIREVAELISPLQSDILLKEITQKHFAPDNDDDFFGSMVATYQEASSPFLKRQILSLFVNQYSKETLLSAIPSLTKHKIDSARKYAMVNRLDQLPTTSSVTSKLPTDKVQHFIGFISQPQFIQDVAFGERVIKLSTGQKVHIPDVIRTVIGSRIISTYLAYCAEVNFPALKRSSLYYILKQCSASQRKSLCGLDGTTADGMTSLDKLVLLSENMMAYSVNTRENVFKDIESRLHVAKRFLSYDYQWHVQESSQVPDHCIKYSLSHGTVATLSETCSHLHEDSCQFCTNITSVIDDLEQIIVDGLYPTDEVRAEFIHDFQLCKDKIFQWKQHILRTVNQEAAKTSILEKLEENEALIVMDWAMKFLPWIDKEKQTDFYGKKGINWHVSVVLSHNEKSQITTDCYVHLFNSIPQGWFAVASILENLLQCIKSQNSKITRVYLRSDNAACYHCSPLIASIHGISERTGIHICRYDFSEAQSGKDICDRRTAPMKIHVKRYGNEGHNITTAEELKVALESYGGIQDTHVYTAEIDFDCQNMNKCSIPEINLYNNFQFEETGIRMWLGYNIGEGKFIPYKTIHGTANSQQGDTNLVILEHPKGTKRRCDSCPRKRKYKDTLQKQEEEAVDEVDDYTCGECGITFNSLKDYNLHQDLGNHKINSEDRVKMIWSTKCVTIKKNVTKHPSVCEIQDTQNSLVKGWALKGKRVSKRFSKKVKDFVAQLYDEGERTGRKYTPTEASKKLRSARDGNGNRLFLPEEWLSSQQVQGLFCRHTQKAVSSVETKEENDEDLDEIINEIVRHENEVNLIQSICM